MKNKIITLSILFFNLFSFSQNEKINYDKEFINFIQEKKQYSDFSFKGTKYERLKMFFDELKKEKNNILSDEFIKKPTDNILLSVYLDQKLKWNSFNRSEERLKEKKVIKESLNEVPRRNELLAIYYNYIFSNVMNKQNEKDYTKDILLDKLNLNRQEQMILYYCFIRFPGSQVDLNASSGHPRGCFFALEYLKKLPTFNSVSFHKFKIYDLEDFGIKIDKRYPKVSFLKYSKFYYDRVIKSLNKCENN